MAEEVHSYRVVNSVDTSRRYTRASIWFHKWRWLHGIMVTGFVFAFAALITNAVSVYVLENSGASASLLWAIVTGFVLGAIYCIYYYWSVVDRRLKADSGESWDCEITDDTWSHKRQDGTRVSIPWTIMEIEFTHRDAFLIKYGRDHVWAIRKPLQDAGLEQIFLERISKGPEEAR